MLSPTAIKLRQQLAASLMPNTQQYTHPLQVFGDMAKTYASALMQSKLMDQYDANKVQANKALAAILQGKEVSQTVPVPIYNQAAQMSDVSDPGLLAQTLQGKTGGSVATFPAGTSFDNQPTQRDLDLYAETAAGDYAPNVDVTVTGRVPYSKAEMAEKVLGNSALMEYSPELASTILGQALAPTKYKFFSAGKNAYVGNETTGEVTSATLPAGAVPDKIFDDPKDRERFVFDLRKDYAKMSQNLQNSRAAVTRMVEAADRGTPASDLSLIYDFFKAKDPGSTVMQGEFENAQDVRGVSGTIQGLLIKARSGQKLTAAERQAFIDEAKSSYNAWSDNFKQERGVYVDAAKRIGEDADTLFPDYSATALKRSRATPVDVASINAATSMQDLNKLGEAILNMDPGPERTALETAFKARSLELGGR